jgi:hypothetical protein
MVGQYVDIIKVHEGKRIELSNGDLLFYSTFHSCWCVEYKASGYSARLLDPDSSPCIRYKDAIASYESRTSNSVIG